MKQPFLRPARRAAIAAAALLTIGLAGCAAVGPNFRPPAAPAATRYAGAQDKAPVGATLTPETRVTGPWWRALGSADLDAVMERALAHNETLAVAQATLDRATADVEAANGARLPNAKVQAAYARQRVNLSSVGFPGFPNPTFGLYSIGPSVSYDLDIFGGERRQLEAARATAEVERIRADAAYLTLTADVALQAVTIASLRAQLDGVAALVADDRQSIDILRAAEAAGGNPASAKLGGQQQLARDEALAPPLEAQLAKARHALSLLTGDPPDRWSPPEFSIASFSPPAVVPVVIPSVLVRRRPDIQAAEAQIHADTALVGVQAARLYPDVRLVAGITQGALTPDALFGFGATGYSFGPTLSLPIFDGGVIRADRRAAQAQARGDLAQYRQTVTAAFTQVSDVLSALAEDEARLDTLTRAERLAGASLDDARAAYRLGGGTLANVVAADRAWRQAGYNRIEAEGQRLSDIVALYGATATDWGAPAQLTRSAPP